MLPGLGGSRMDPNLTATLALWSLADLYAPFEGLVMVRELERQGDQWRRFTREGGGVCKSVNDFVKSQQSRMGIQGSLNGPAAPPKGRPPLSVSAQRSHTGQVRHTTPQTMESSGGRRELEGAGPGGAGRRGQGQGADQAPTSHSHSGIPLQSVVRGETDGGDDDAPLLGERSRTDTSSAGQEDVVLSQARTQVGDSSSNKSVREPPSKRAKIDNRPQGQVLVGNKSPPPPPLLLLNKHSRGFLIILPPIKTNKNLQYHAPPPIPPQVPRTQVIKMQVRKLQHDVFREEVEESLEVFWDQFSQSCLSGVLQTCGMWEQCGLHRTYISLLDSSAGEVWDRVCGKGSFDPACQSLSLKDRTSVGRLVSCSYLKKQVYDSIKEKACDPGFGVKGKSGKLDKAMSPTQLFGLGGQGVQQRRTFEDGEEALNTFVEHAVEDILKVFKLQSICLKNVLPLTSRRNMGKSFPDNFGASLDDLFFSNPMENPSAAPNLESHTRRIVPEAVIMAFVSVRPRLCHGLFH